MSAQSLLHLNVNNSIFTFFFFNDTATTEIYTLSLHDALPISSRGRPCTTSTPARPHRARSRAAGRGGGRPLRGSGRDRKSTRLNSSHGYISYAVFCLKKKKKFRLRDRLTPRLRSFSAP